MKHYRLWGVLALLGLASACRPGGTRVPEVDTPQYGLREDSTMVVTAHPEASRIGVAVLRAGGNAVDAAIAVQFALAVSFPYAGNIGGGGFMVLRTAEGEVITLDFREKAPLAADRDMYLDEQGEVIPKLSARGHLSSGVPGVVDGMVRAHKRYGTLPWKDLVQPAIDLAQNGYRVSDNQADWLNRQQEEFIEYNPDSSYYLVKAEGAWQAGDTIRMADFAATLRRIRDRKRAGFYAGETAEMLLAEQAAHGGIITQADLDAYAAQWRPPITGNYRGYTIHSMPPPSSGGIVLLQILGMLEGQDLAKYSPTDAAYVHRLVEAERRAYADRAEYLADPDFVKIPVTHLLSDGYLAARMMSFSPERATPSDSIGPGAAPAESEETTHFSILDQPGNAVAVTTTINSPYGSKVWVKGAGFLLNNEMDDFSAKPGVPNIYGLVGAEANSIRPGKRMLSSMTPTIIEKEGQVWMVLGTPGGSTIITSVLQCFLDVAEHGMTMQEAVGQLRFHHQWRPDKVFIEEGALAPETIAELEAMGHTVEVRSPIGRVDAILVHPDGLLEGAADPRRDDEAEGY
ncbi:MAG: gamma-glutamyltransferase [Bacteroidota bacterium]